MPTKEEYQKYRDYYKRANKLRYKKMREWYSQYAKDHKERINAHTRRYRSNRYKWIKELKESTPCKDCKRYYPSVCMDYDHRNPKEKVTNVGRMMNMPRVLIEMEIAKCDLVCSNCHRIRTSKRK